MAYIEELPQVSFGKAEKPVDWRSVKDDDDDDAPASAELIAMLGFDPDEAETSDRAAVLDEIKSELKSIKSEIAARRRSEDTYTDPDVPSKGSSTFSGMVDEKPYKGYSIKQDYDGVFHAFSTGGALVCKSKELDVLKKKIDEIDVKGAKQ